MKPDEKRQILESFDVSERLERLSQFVGHRLEVLRLSREINAQTQEKNRPASWM